MVTTALAIALLIAILVTLGAMVLLGVACVKLMKAFETEESLRDSIHELTAQREWLEEHLESLDDVYVEQFVRAFPYAVPAFKLYQD